MILFEYAVSAGEGILLSHDIVHSARLEHLAAVVLALEGLEMVIEPVSYSRQEEFHADRSR